MGVADLTIQSQADLLRKVLNGGASDVKFNAAEMIGGGHCLFKGNEYVCTLTDDEATLVGMIRGTDA